MNAEYIYLLNNLNPDDEANAKIGDTIVGVYAEQGEAFRAATSLNESNPVCDPVIVECWTVGRESQMVAVATPTKAGFLLELVK